MRSPRGRKRTTGDRYKSGKLRPRRDVGTQESIAKRAAIVGAADPALAHYPLGVAHARGFISDRERRAGELYARAFSLRLDGRPERLASPMRHFQPKTGREPSDETLERARTTFEVAATTLARHGAETKRTVDLVAVFEAWPDWLITAIRGESLDQEQQTERARLITGLRSLVDVF